MQKLCIPMNTTIAEQFSDVTVLSKANVYFDGKVVSHTLLFQNQSKKTLGLIYVGKFHFGTKAAERMEIVSGNCIVQFDGSSDLHSFQKGESFEVPADSGFDIEVTQGICEYICSFLA